MQNDNQKKYSGEEQYYDQRPQIPNYQEPQIPITQNFGTGLQGKLIDRDQPPKRRNGWKVIAQVLFITTVVFFATTVLAYNHIINPPAKAVVPASTTTATQVAPQTTPRLANETPTSASTPSSTPTVQPSTPVASGLITENLLLTCGGCNDPIHVTINTIQIDTANGRMIWDNTLKDVTNSGIGYSINEYDLQPNASQTKVPAILSQTIMSGSNRPYDVQAIFAFVPFHNVTYVLTVMVGFNGVYTTFDPVKITF